MRQKLLLLEDVDGLGRKGDVVTSRPGFMRNFLLPQRKAEVASTHVLRKQEKLRAERAEQAVVDRSEAEALAATLNVLTLEIRVKVDPDGHMYGSVSAGDIASLLQEQGHTVERKMVILPRPIKEVGAHTVTLRLKESVPAKIAVAIIPEGMEHLPGAENVVAPIPKEGTADETPSE